MQNEQCGIVRGLVRLLLGVLCSLHYNSASSAQDTPASTTIQPEQPAEVHVGIYLVRIPALNFRDNQFTIDAYLWFRWQGELEPTPPEAFELCNGVLEEKKVCEEKQIQVTVNGHEEEWHYCCLRIRGLMTKFWDASRFPLDRHELIIAIEDSEREAIRLRYVVDADNSNIDPQCRVTGWECDPPEVSAAVYRYDTNYGDISLPSDHASCYSRLTVSVAMRRASWVYSAKVLNGLYIAVAIAMLAFFIKPTDLDPRFGVGIGAIFASIANQYVVSSSLPECSQFTLVEKLHCLGNAVILLSLLLSVVSLMLFEFGRESASRMLDRMAFWALLLVYVAANVWLMA